jgi:hypothetical protein
MSIKEKLKLPRWGNGVMLAHTKSTSNAVYKLKKETGKDIITCVRGNDLIVLYMDSFNIEDRRLATPRVSSDTSHNEQKEK